MGTPAASHSTSQQESHCTMTAPTARRAAPRVLITNDDGPPCHESPFIEGLYKCLREQLGWEDLRVVIPSSQKSWIGKAYQIKDTIGVSSYTPPADISDKPWTMLDGTPATCANIALHNLYPGEIDLVVSGPNYGRNTSSAFALSSGTIGAALSASMSGTPAIALSYGIFDRPIPEGVVDKAHELACATIKKLWNDVFCKSEGLADVYNVNIPLTTNILDQTASSPKIQWTTLAGARYGRLFVPINEAKPKTETEREAEEAGPAAVPIHSPPGEDAPKPEHPHKASPSTKAYKFKPDISLLINPDECSLVPGTDIHALHNGLVSVTPLKATFGLGEPCSRIETEEGNGKGLWKL